MRIPRMIAVMTCVLCALAVSTSVAAASKPQPKTVFQCQKAFSKAAAKRSACMQRVTGEKPGASCAHPLKSYYAQDLEHLGDTKDMPISTEIVDGPADYFIGRHLEPPEVTNYVSISFTSVPKVIICGAELTTYAEPNQSIVNHYRLPTGPHGDKPFVVGLSEGSFKVVVFGRYASGRA